jgi:hypothetical protein
MRMKPMKQRFATSGEAVQAAKRRADEAYARWARVHRELEQVRRLATGAANTDPDAQARIARLQAEEEKLFAEAGELWRAYTRAECAALWNRRSKPILPRTWLDTLARAQRALRDTVAAPIFPVRGETSGTDEEMALRQTVRNVSAPTAMPPPASGT